jgi:hypothetical protein
MSVLNEHELEADGNGTIFTSFGSGGGANKSYYETKPKAPARNPALIAKHAENWGLDAHAYRDSDNGTRRATPAGG